MRKKRLDDELKTYFADLFDDESDKEYYDLLKSRTLAMLQSISGEGDAAKIERLTQALLLHVGNQNHLSARIMQKSDTKRILSGFVCICPSTPIRTLKALRRWSFTTSTNTARSK